MAQAIPERGQRRQKAAFAARSSIDPNRRPLGLHPPRAAAIVGPLPRGARRHQSEIMPDIGGIAGDRLKCFIERIERLEEERRVLGEDIKEVYAEAKGTGFDTKSCGR